MISVQKVSATLRAAGFFKSIRGGRNDRPGYDTFKAGRVIGVDCCRVPALLTNMSEALTAAGIQNEQKIDCGYIVIK